MEKYFNLIFTFFGEKLFYDVEICPIFSKELFKEGLLIIVPAFGLLTFNLFGIIIKTTDTRFRTRTCSFIFLTFYYILFSILTLNIFYQISNGFCRFELIGLDLHTVVPILLIHFIQLQR